MQSPFCELAIESALRYGNALLKFISPNDVGQTGGHQYGFYLPKSVYQMFTPQPPLKGAVTKHPIRIVWQDDIATDSVITWYGAKTRSEYRLTRFGRGFPYLVHDMVGDLLVLIRKTEDEFLAFVLDLEDDIETIQEILGVRVTDSWGIYQDGVERFETEDECIERRFREFVKNLTQFPQGSVFSSQARAALQECLETYHSMTADDRITACMDAEYRLFKMGERQICQDEVVRLFRDVDDFLKTASSILNRRKSRAGRSLENHVEQVLLDSGIPHKMRPRIDGKPDIIIPNEASYHDIAYPLEKLLVVGVKTTCKDRWRQVLNEGKRVSKKYILTVQPGISSNQLIEMRDANVTLVVPKSLHKKYPAVENMSMLSVEQFVTTARETIN
jgi:EcoRII C terminal/Restriction endonuclease EcoRII, N-terminal